jgi:hypothetical protein
LTDGWAGSTPVATALNTAKALGRDVLLTR